MLDNEDRNNVNISEAQGNIHLHLQYMFSDVANIHLQYMFLGIGNIHLQYLFSDVGIYSFSSLFSFCLFPPLMLLKGKLQFSDPDNYTEFLFFGDKCIDPLVWLCSVKHLVSKSCKGP